MLTRLMLFRTSPNKLPSLADVVGFGIATWRDAEPCCGASHLARFSIQGPQCDLIEASSWMEHTFGVQEAKIDDCLADHGFLCGCWIAMRPTEQFSLRVIPIQVTSLGLWPATHAGIVGRLRSRECRGMNKLIQVAPEWMSQGMMANENPLYHM